MNNSIYYLLMAILAELQSQRPELGLAERSELQARADSFMSRAVGDNAKARLKASSSLDKERTGDTFSCPAAPPCRGGVIGHE